jgi:hypothetical protein
MDLEALVADYEARKPLYTEGDFVERFTQIKAARTTGMSNGPDDKAPDDWMIALLASGRVSDAEYFRLARLLGVDATGLIYSEPVVERSFAELLRAALQAIGRFVSSLRRD